MALIIGDIHGLLDQLNDLLDFATPSTNQTIITTKLSNLTPSQRFTQQSCHHANPFR